jgi:hypothetical protein
MMSAAFPFFRYAAARLLTDEFTRPFLDRIAFLLRGR